MTKLLSYDRIFPILTTFPNCAGILVVCVMLSQTYSATAQTRRSVVSIPYSYAEQSQRSSTAQFTAPTNYTIKTQEGNFEVDPSGRNRVNPIRLAQAQTEIVEEDPFAPAPLDTQDLTEFGEDIAEPFPEIQPEIAEEEDILLPGIEEEIESDLTEDDLRSFREDAESIGDIGDIMESDPLEIADPRELLPSLIPNDGVQRRTSNGVSTPGVTRNPVTDPEKGLSLEILNTITDPEEEAMLRKIQEQNEIQRKQNEARGGGTSSSTTRPTLSPSPAPQPKQPEPEWKQQGTEEQYPPQKTVEEPSQIGGTQTPTPITANDLAYGKRRGKRCFQDCGVGPAMAFGDQCEYPIEIAPFAGFLVEDPYARIIDLGGCGIDFYGYPRDCPSGRPYGWLFDNMEVFAGANGFGTRSGKIDETSFGFHEGVNWAGSVSPRFGIAAQFGVRSVQRTIEGTLPMLEEANWDNGGKSQVFITAGFFKRARSNPFQYGLVYDWMSDNKYKNLTTRGGKKLDSFNLGQVRTELSYKCCSGFTFGFRGTFGLAESDDLFESTDYTAKAATQLHGFFEKPLWCGSSAGFSAGGTPKGNAILSAYYDQPLSNRFSLKTGFTYMLPKESKDEASAFVEDERSAWEAGITLTFHPHGGAFSKNCNPLRAMFDVAGNGSMITSHRK